MLALYGSGDVSSFFKPQLLAYDGLERSRRVVNTNLYIRNNYIIFGVKYRSQKPDIGNADREYI